MSNLRSDCRDLVKDRPAGDVWRTHIERLCQQIDLLEEAWHEANRRLAQIRRGLEQAVCVKEPEVGVILLSDYGTTHTEELLGGKKCQVYDHDYFSPLGDCLIAVWKQARTVGIGSDQAPIYAEEV